MAEQRFWCQTLDSIVHIFKNGDVTNETDDLDRVVLLPQESDAYILDELTSSVLLYSNTHGVTLEMV